jgi:hypothetical protein
MEEVCLSRHISYYAISHINIFFEMMTEEQRAGGRIEGLQF